MSTTTAGTTIINVSHPLMTQAGVRAWAQITFDPATNGIVGGTGNLQCMRCGEAWSIALKGLSINQELKDAMSEQMDEVYEHARRHAAETSAANESEGGGA